MENNVDTPPNWDKATWYFAPEEETSDLLDIVRDDVDVCGRSLPFTTQAAMNAGYS